jgi:hypothetical protein
MLAQAACRSLGSGEPRVTLIYQSLYTFFWFGTCLRYLQDASPAFLVHGPANVIFNLQELFTRLGDLELKVTKELAHQKLDSLLGALEALPGESFLPDDMAEELRNSVTALRDTLEAEIVGVGAYTPTPKRIDLNRLLRDVASLFAPDVFDRLPELARYDLKECGKCIAFEVPTAAAFHVLRATEAALRDYYRQMIRHNRVGSNMWGPIVADLRKRHRTKKYEALNSQLDNIRISFRNPTQHPEAIYDIHEVQDLWALCVDVLNRMHKALVSEDRA